MARRRRRLAVDVLHQLGGGAYGEETPPGHSLRSLKEGVQMTNALCGCADLAAVHSALGAGASRPPMLFTSFAMALTWRYLAPALRAPGLLALLTVK